MANDSVHVFLAGDFDEAFTRALELGRRREEVYRNADGQLVRWRLAEIVTLDVIQEPIDGAEVHSEFEEYEPPRDMAVDAAFRPEDSEPSQTVLAMPEFRIDSSEPEHFQRAIDATAELRKGWPDRHPIHDCVAAAKELARGFRLDWGDDDAGFERYLKDTWYPAMTLCRLARSMDDIGLLGGTESEEIRQMADPDPRHFAHSEFLLHVAVKLAYSSRERVRVVRTEKSKTPDLEVASERYAIECTARVERSPDEAFARDFEHARKKFDCYLSRQGRADWVGVLAIDYGLIVSPEIPNLDPRPQVRASKAVQKNETSWLKGRRRDIDRNFKNSVNQSVAVVLLTATSLRLVSEGDDVFLEPADLSGWHARRDRVSQVPRSIQSAFFELPDGISSSANRTSTE